jgi:hypothetical protein
VAPLGAFLVELREGMRVLWRITEGEPTDVPSTQRLAGHYCQLIAVQSDDPFRQSRCGAVPRVVDGMSTPQLVFGRGGLTQSAPKIDPTQSKDSLSTRENNDLSTGEIF